MEGIFIVPTLHFHIIVWFSSQAIGKETPCAFANSATPRVVSSTAIPMASTFPPLCCFSCSRSLSDFLQAWHQVAQNWTTVTFPEPARRPGRRRPFR